MFRAHYPHHHESMWVNDMLGLSPPPQSRRSSRPTLMTGGSPPRHPPIKDQFLDTLCVKHLKDDHYYIPLPENVSFEHLNVDVDSRNEFPQLIITYVPTQTRCKFQIPKNIDINQIEAKRNVKDHILQLRMPEKESKTVPVQFVPEVVSASRASASVDEKESRSEYEERPPSYADVQSGMADRKPVETCLYTAVHPETREEYNFEEVAVPPDHDCAFHCLGLSREEACDLLMSQKDNIEVRKIVAPEIQEGFIGLQLPKAMESQDVVREIRQEFFDATEKLSSELRNAKEILEGLGIPCKDMDAKAIISRFQRSQSATILSTVERLVKCYGALQEVEKKIFAFCMSQEVFVSFIDDYLRIRGSWAGYVRSYDGKQRTSSLDAIAMLKGMKVYIWVASHGTKLDLVHESPNSTFTEGRKEDYQVIHMIHTNHLSHFNRLMEA